MKKCKGFLGKVIKSPLKLWKSPEKSSSRLNLHQHNHVNLPTNSTYFTDASSISCRFFLHISKFNIFTDDSISTSIFREIKAKVDRDKWITDFDITSREDPSCLCTHGGLLIKWNGNPRNETKIHRNVYISSHLYLETFLYLRLEISQEPRREMLPDRSLKLQMSPGPRWLMWVWGVVSWTCSSHWYCTNFYNSFLTVVAIFFPCNGWFGISFYTFCESSRYGAALFSFNLHTITCQKRYRGDFQNMFAFVLREKVLMDFFLCNRRIFDGARPL